MRRPLMVRFLIAVAIVVMAVALGTVAGLALAEAVDARYHAARFQTAPKGCPLGVARGGTLITPLCAPSPGW